MTYLIDTDWLIDYLKGKERFAHIRGELRAKVTQNMRHFNRIANLKLDSVDW
jgi:predicted nucleic acid-binding protein